MFRFSALVSSFRHCSPDGREELTSDKAEIWLPLEKIRKNEFPT
jgi:hypothetical protein